MVREFCQEYLRVIEVLTGEILLERSDFRTDSAEQTCTAVRAMGLCDDEAHRKNPLQDTTISTRERKGRGVVVPRVARQREAAKRGSECTFSRPTTVSRLASSAARRVAGLRDTTRE